MEIMPMLLSNQSWEQILYHIVEEEKIDPSDVDIKKLSTSFLDWMAKYRFLDFKIPAKYLLLSALLLRMKADQQLYFNGNGNGFHGSLDGSETDLNYDIAEEANGITKGLSIDFPARFFQRPVILEELVGSLSRAMKAEKRKEDRLLNNEGRKTHLTIVPEIDITQRINSLYQKITALIDKIGDEITFSELVKSNSKKEVVEHFLPLLYLDQEKKVTCRQEEIFEEIFIKKNNGTAH